VQGFEFDWGEFAEPTLLAAAMVGALDPDDDCRVDLQSGVDVDRQRPMNLRELLDNMSEGDREWLAAHRTKIVPNDAPESVGSAINSVVAYMINPMENELDQMR
jgi:hypothetical protein